MFEPYSIIKRIITTEKSTKIQKDGNFYTLLVSPFSNKTQIKKAIETIFKVNVEKVNIINSKSKKKRIIWRGTTGEKPGFKKAIIKLKPGETIGGVEKK